MSNAVNLYYLLGLPACLIIGIAYAWLLYGHTKQLNKHLRFLLATFRAIAVMLVLWLLFSPLIRQISYTLEKPILVIGQDNSISAGNAPSAFNKKKYESDLKTLTERLSRKFEVQVYNFSDSVKSGLDFNYPGKTSNAAHFIKTINNKYLNRNIGAVVLATDGIFNRGGNPIYDLNNLKAPVYTIALGDTIPKKDLLIANVNYNNLVYLDNEFIVEVQTEAYESKGENTKLSIFENGKQIQGQQIQLNSNAFTKSIAVKIKATKPGFHKYTLSLSKLENEASLKNNNQNIIIEVIDDRQKVLIAGAGPHPDIAALKQSITLNKHYDVNVVLNADLDTVKPANYGLVILYQLPSAGYNTANFNKKLKESKAPVWYITGAQSNFTLFNQEQQAVTLALSSSAILETFSNVNPAFSTFSLDENAKRTISQYDPLQIPRLKVILNTMADVAIQQRLGKSNTTIPQLFFTALNGKKTAYLIGEGLWRWRLSEAKSREEAKVFNQLMSQTVQYLSVKDDKRKFKVTPIKNAFDENESILLNAVLYNDSYHPVNAPEVNIQIQDEHKKTFNFSFSRLESAYQLNAGPLPGGNYSYTANTQLGSKKYSSTGAFYVNTLLAEYQQTIANHQLLYTISHQNNGKMYGPENLLQILNDLEQNEQIKTLSYEDRKFEELISFKWIFAIIITLLTLEWVLRKRNAEV
ncbi:hypothetical protein LPB86_19620 [Pedobacter sp. MC2016-14]|uniref:hypothetical protein n=1 Tax=Pedobacter sp. MC2016-14 TaxID=2897327 RepID=UPI001E4ED358|nr:hypothetical protein [Pedobacter sp. MC2016-14]MCD0490457.1 hypothetical protein [Pedobacter sp. MC2016-14]